MPDRKISWDAIYRQRIASPRAMLRCLQDSCELELGTRAAWSVWRASVQAAQTVERLMPAGSPFLPADKWQKATEMIEAWCTLNDLHCPPHIISWYLAGAVRLLKIRQKQQAGKKLGKLVEDVAKQLTRKEKEK